MTHQPTHPRTLDHLSLLIFMLHLSSPTYHKIYLFGLHPRIECMHQEGRVVLRNLSLILPGLSWALQCLLSE